MKIISLSIDNLEGVPVKISTPRGIPTGGINTLADIITTLLGLIITFAIVFSLFMLIYAGWQWMTSAGDKQKVQQARQRITFVIVGLIVVFISFFVLSILGRFLGVNLLKLP